MIKHGEKYVKYMSMPKCVDDHKDNVIQALNEHGKKVVDALIKITSRGSRSGKTYFYKGRKYQASAIGEPPQSVSGKLNKSFKHECNLQRLIVGNTAFSKGAPYPLFLEEGLKRFYFANTNEDLSIDLQNDLQRIKLSV